jgi:polysaccharide pyruvyl transferase WcaK-like protein
MTFVQPARIALLSPQSTRNLGDTATFVAAVAAYRRRLPNVEIISVVPEPAQTAAALGTAGFPLYGDGGLIPAGTATSPGAGDGRPSGSAGRIASMRRVYAFARELDAVVFTGGGQLDDFWGGPWSLPFWVLTWAAAARARGAKVLFHAIGFDRLTSRTSRTMALNALRIAHYRSFRDAESHEMLKKLGLGAPCDVLPDLAFALEPGDGAGSTQAKAVSPFVIVNPVSMRMWTQQRDRTFEDYLEGFVALSRWLLEQGLAVKLLSTQDRMDDDALEFVANVLRSEKRSNWERVHVTRLDQFMTLARDARLVVSSRLHGLILSFVAGTPAVSVAPMRKMTRIMLDVGLGDYNLELSSLRQADLIATVGRALASEAELRRRISETAGEYRRQLNRNFDHLVAAGLLGEQARRQFQPDGRFETLSA